MTANPIKGTFGDDNLTGTSGNDTFNLTRGGNDTVDAGGGNDIFWMGATLNAGDKLDGGDGIDQVNLSGDYSAGLVFAADTIANIEKLYLAAGHDYDLTLNDGNVAAAGRLLVNAQALGAGNRLTFDGSAELDGHFNIFAGAGDDAITGGAANDMIHLDRGGNDTVHGGGGNDTIFLGDTFTSADAIDGGSGRDTVILDGMGDDSVAFSATTMTNVETLVLGAGNSYDLITDDATVGRGAMMTIDGSALKGVDAFGFDGSAESDGAFHFIAGSSLQTILTGGGGNDIFDLTHVDSTALTQVDGQGGNDVFQFLANFDSSSQTVDGGTGTNTLSLNGDYSFVSLVGGVISNIQDVVFGGGHSYTDVQVFDDISGGAPTKIDTTGLSGSDSFTLDATNSTDGLLLFAGGGTYDLTGSTNADKFYMGAHFSASDQADGGAGLDKVILEGDYTGANALTSNASTLTNVEVLQLNAGHSYDITTDDATVATNKVFHVDASALGAGNALAFDGSAETDGTFVVVGGAGNDALTGGEWLNFFDLSLGGNDTVHASPGPTSVYMGAEFTAADQIDGTDGATEIELDGDYSGAHAVVTNAATLQDIAEIDVDAGHNYDLTVVDANLDTGFGTTVDGEFLGPSNWLHFDGSAETTGAFQLIDGLGDDVLIGGGGNDFLSFDGGGTDIGKGGGGSDFVDACGHLDGADQFDGGSGIDAIELTASETTTGNYTGANALHLTAAMMANFEQMDLDGGGSYDITTVDANVAAGVSFGVDASVLGAGESLTFDGSAETDGSFSFLDGAGNDVLTGGALADTFDIGGGGNDTVHGNGGNDQILALGTGTFTAADTIDGGAGNDTLTLDGDYSAFFQFGAATITNVETLKLNSSQIYNLAFDDGNVGAGDTLTVDGSAGSGNQFVNGFAETDGNFHFIFGSGATNLYRGGAGDDVFDMTQGGATSNEGDGNSGNDTFNFANHWINGHTFAYGGAGADTANFSGAYVSFIQIDGDAAGGMEKFVFAGGNSYTGLFVGNGGGNAFTGDSMTVDASALGASDTFAFGFDNIGYAGFKVIGGAGADTISVSSGGAFDATAQLDGGAGTDLLMISGDYSGAVLAFTATTVTNFETISFANTGSYKIATDDGTVAAGQTLTVNANTNSSQFVQFDGSAETNGHFTFNDGAGNDVLTGGALSDTFSMADGGTDTVHGGGGNDTFNFGATFTAADTVEGGIGTDLLVLAGGGTVVLTATALTNVEQIDFNTGSYNYISVDATVAAGASLAVNGANVGAGNSLTFDGSAETDGSFAFSGSAGNDLLTGGAQNDSFNLAAGGNDTAHGGAGNDTFSFGAVFTAADTVDGGANSDTISLNGDYSAGLTLGAATITSIENIVMAAAGHSYKLTTVDANVASGTTLTINASALGASDTLTFDGSAETNGGFAVIGGAGDDGFTLSNAAALGASTFNGGAGNDTLSLNGTFNVTLGAATLTSVETLKLLGSGSYNITFVDANVASGATLTVDGSANSGNESFFGQAETDGNFRFIAGTGTSNQFVGGGGNDTAVIGSRAVLAGSTFDGGNGSDTLELNGDFSTALTFTSTTFINVETLKLDAGHSYSFVTNNANIASATTLAVDASALASGNAVLFDATAESNGGVAMTGGAGNDKLTVGAAGVLSATSFNGGLGADTLALNGNYATPFTFSATTITNVEILDLSAGNKYVLKLNDANVAANTTLFITGAAGDGSDFDGIDASAETNGFFAFTASAGNDTFVLSSASVLAGSTYDGGLGNDTLELNGNFSAGVTFTAATITNVETLKLDAGHSYNLATADPNVAAGTLLTVDGGSLGAGDSFTFNGAQETNGRFWFTGGTGNNTLTGGAGNDTFDLNAGGDTFNGTSDTAQGGGGNDLFQFGIAFHSGSETVDGGTGSDTLELGGVFHTGDVHLSLAAPQITGVETLQIDDSTNLEQVTITGDITGGGGTLTIISGVSSLSASDYTVDVSAATTPTIDFTGGEVDDTIVFGGNFKAADKIDGGGFSDVQNVLVLQGNYTGGNALVFNSDTIQNIGLIELATSGSYDITLNTGNVAGGNSIGIHGVNFDLTGTLRVDASAFTTQGVVIYGGDGDDTLIGGSGFVQMLGQGGNDILDAAHGLNIVVSGGAGQDTISLNASTTQTLLFDGVSDSTSTSYDIITGLNFDNAQMSIGHGVGGIDAATAGSLSTASFDADLGAALSGHLNAGDAILITANAGTLHDEVFLVVDMNGIAGYQAGQDLVIDVTGYSGTLTTGDFS